jgi:hypothetical protein
MPSSQRMIRSTAIVSNIVSLPASSRRPGGNALDVVLDSSNACATHQPITVSRVGGLLLLMCVIVALGSVPSRAQAQEQDGEARVNRTAAVSLFLAGAGAGLAAHEGGHLLFAAIFDADPRLRHVEFHGIPFFAITHDAGLSRRREFTIASAGFWAQHVGSEWLLTARPRLRRERAPLAKGLLGFNILASVAYAGAAFARTGPEERDTRGIARGARLGERWVGAIVLAPAVLDGWRYLDPDARWAVWTSRAVKMAGVLLLLR